MRPLTRSHTACSSSLESTCSYVAPVRVATRHTYAKLLLNNHIHAPSVQIMDMASPLLNSRPLRYAFDEGRCLTGQSGDIMPCVGDWYVDPDTRALARQLELMVTVMSKVRCWVVQGYHRCIANHRLPEAVS